MEKQNETSKPTQNPEPSKIDKSQPLGDMLKKARQKKGMNIDDVAEQTNILKRHLLALENNDFQALPQPTFARGFAVNYGKHLGLDAHEIGQIFDAQYPSELKQKFANSIPTGVQSMDTLERDSGNSSKINPLIIVGLLIALVLAYFIFSTVTKAHKANQADNTTPAVISPQEQATGASLNNTGSAVTTITPTASPTAKTNLPTAGSAIASNVAITPSATASRVASVIAPTTTTTAIATASTPTLVASATQSGTDKLDIWVKKPTNIQVTDADGKVMLQGSHGRGGINLTGKAPFTVNIDNVTNVSLDFNKQPIKLGQYSQNNQANFTLKP